MDQISIYISQLVDIMGSLGFLGGFLLALLESIIPIIPLGAIIGLNMLSFGNIIGFLISYMGTVSGCMLSFCLFRYVIREKILNLFSKKKKEQIDKWMEKLTNIDFNTLVVLIALPITPACLVNIAAGISDIPLRKYLIAMLIGKPSMLIFYGYIAVSFVESLKDPINFLKIGGLILGAYIISKIIEKIVKVEK